MTSIVVAGLCAGVAEARVAAGQVISGAVVTPRTAQECATAARVLLTGDVGNAEEQLNARQELTCTSVRQAMPTAFRRWKTATDVKHTNWFFAPSWADDSMLVAALDVAGDPRASEVARFFTVRLLMARIFEAGTRMMPGDTTEYFQMFSSYGCQPDQYELHAMLDRTPVSATVRDRAIATVRTLEVGANARLVRGIANCFMNAWRGERKCEPVPLDRSSYLSTDRCASPQPVLRLNYRGRRLETVSDGPKRVVSGLNTGGPTMKSRAQR
jgi:hypothetical protein